MRIPEPPGWAEQFVSVGVTGTNGKTSCSLWTAAALRCLRNPVAAITSLGAFVDEVPYDVGRSYAGLLRTMQHVRARGGRYSVVEFASWSLAHGYAAAWPCRIAVFTNLTHEHLDIHGSMEAYLASKAQLFASLPAGGTAVLNASDPASAVLEELVRHKTHCIWYGSRAVSSRALDFALSVVDVRPGATRVAVEVGGARPARVEFSLRATGAMFAENATAALAAATAAGVPLEAAVNAISSVPAPPGRFEVLNENPLVVLDFAHTPDALARTLDTCRKLERQRTLVVVGAGGERDRTKRPLLGQAASKADIVYATSDNPRSEDPRRIVDEIIEGITELARVRRRPERQVAIEEAIFEARASDIVLVAGRGPETHQATAAGWVPLSDRDVVRESLARRALQSTVTP